MPQTPKRPNLIQFEPSNKQNQMETHDNGTKYKPCSLPSAYASVESSGPKPLTPSRLAASLLEPHVHNDIDKVIISIQQGDRVV